MTEPDLTGTKSFNICFYLTTHTRYEYDLIIEIQTPSKKQLSEIIKINERNITQRSF